VRWARSGHDGKQGAVGQGWSASSRPLVAPPHSSQPREETGQRPSDSRRQLPRRGAMERQEASANRTGPEFIAPRWVRSRRVDDGQQRTLAVAGGREHPQLSVPAGSHLGRAQWVQWSSTLLNRLPRALRSLATRWWAPRTGLTVQGELKPLPPGPSQVPPRRPCPLRAPMNGHERSITVNPSPSLGAVTWAADPRPQPPENAGCAFQARDRWGHIGATSGPRTTGSQRTTPVTIGQATTQLTEHTCSSPQVVAPRPGSLTRKGSQVQTLSRPPLSL
jgi:hypothetical protein